jgi:hypothetical protein
VRLTSETDAVVQMWTTCTSNDEGRGGGSEVERRGRRRQKWHLASSNKGDGGDGGGVTSMGMGVWFKAGDVAHLTAR